MILNWLITSMFSTPFTILAQHIEPFSVIYISNHLALLLTPQTTHTAGRNSPAKQTVADYKSAISDMLNRDLLWEIDAGKQSLIADYLKADPALGPTDGIPELGTLQYSIRFANLLDQFWAVLNCERPGVFFSRDWQTEKLHLIYSPTRQQCFEFLRVELSDVDDDTFTLEHVSGPKRCGPWRAHWWHKYESGYVLEVQYL